MPFPDERLDGPTEDIAVEACRPLQVAGRDLEVADGGVHRTTILSGSEVDLDEQIAAAN